MLTIIVLAVLVLGLFIMPFLDLARISRKRREGNPESVESIGSPPSTLNPRKWRQFYVAAFWLTNVAALTSVVLGSVFPALQGITQVLTLVFLTLFLVGGYRLSRILGSDRVTSTFLCVAAIIPLFAWLQYFGFGRRCAKAFDMQQPIT